MGNLLEDENKCYQYFVENDISTREELRNCLKSKPLEGIRSHLVEMIFADFNKKRKVERDREREKNRKKKDCYVVVCINDMHIPHHDPKTCELVFRCIRDIKPHELILNGDIIDCYQESTFLKDPGVKEYLQDECNIFYDIFKQVRKDHPDMRMSFVLGNHEARIKREQWAHPSFYGVYGLTIPALLRFDELKIDYYEKERVIDGFRFTHGTKVNQHASYTAKNEFYNHGCTDGITGHTHRWGCFSQTVDSHTECWLENSCLCDLNPDYIKGVANWQQGFSVIYFYPDSQPDIAHILIRNHKFRFNGVRYE